MNRKKTPTVGLGKVTGAGKRLRSNYSSEPSSAGTTPPWGFGDRTIQAYPRAERGCSSVRRKFHRTAGAKAWSDGCFWGESVVSARISYHSLDALGAWGSQLEGCYSGLGTIGERERKIRFSSIFSGDTRNLDWGTTDEF